MLANKIILTVLYNILTLCPKTGRHENEAKKKKPKEKTFISSGRYSVSYTHLDVYKRQIDYRAM